MKMIDDNKTETIGFKLLNRMGGLWWNIKRPVMVVVCFFSGHSIEFGEILGSWEIGYGRLTPDICTRCWYTDDEKDLEDGVFRSKANRVYMRLIEASPNWLVKAWYLIPVRWLPEWMEY